MTEAGGWGVPVSPEERLAAELEDLEARAGALFDEERAEELEDRARAEYAQVDLAARLAACSGRRVSLDVQGVGLLEGEVERTGAGWLLLVGSDVEWLVLVAAIGAIAGASPRAVPAVARPATARLGPGTVLRAIAEDAELVVLHRRDGVRHEGRLGRIGADFTEVLTASDAGAGVGDVGGPLLVPWAALAAVRRQVDP